ncbi:MAG TPA: hypothetical protein VFI15_09105 [Candidatus Limnocylindrales bacterium]|nr:hypothetical protein [Candidatus Limnocylindrales bacterium]
MTPILTALLIVAAALAGIELIRSKAESLLAWSVFLIALVLVIGRL